ncbi:MAG: nuclease [Planctomycetes bacterium]|nr:nuclease [Planctomycetota bacterium]
MESSVPHPLDEAEPSLVRVVADDRERGAGVIENLMTYPDVEVRIDRLPLGDYQVQSRLLFERKTLLDLAQAIVSGRFLSQAGRLAASSRHPVLILEGGLKALASSGVSRECLQGALISLTLILRIPLLRSFDPEESARLMVYAARQERLCLREGLCRRGYRPKGKKARQLFVLQGFPSIGPKRARKLLEKFGTVEAIVRASADDLASVPGIGEAIASRMREVLS